MTSQNTKSKIIEAMYTLILEKGYDRASIGSIAEIVNIKKASIYYYFKNKEEILIALIDNFNDSEVDFCQFLEKVNTPKEFKDMVLQSGIELIDELKSDIDFRHINAEIYIVAERNPRIKERIVEQGIFIQQQVEKMMVKGAEKNLISRNSNPHTIAQIIILFMQGVASFLAFAQHLEFETAWSELIDRIIY